MSWDFLENEIIIDFQMIFVAMVLYLSRVGISSDTDHQVIM